MDTKESSTKIVACQLTSPELQKRKIEAVASLKKLVLDRKELADGYQYLFEGKDAVLAEIVEFIKTERQCCTFFTFNLTIEDAAGNIWLSITGPERSKAFIDQEMDF